MSIMLKKAAVLKAEPIGNDGYDPIVTFASQIEKESRIKIEEIVRDLNEESEANKFKIGGALARIQANENWWQEAGYQNFKDYVASLGIGYRKAMYLIEFYKKLLELDVPFVKFGGIGSGKIRIIVPVLTKENVDEWVEKAKVLSRSDLEAHIKAEKQKIKTGKEHEPKTITTKTFKLHDDQKQLVNDAIKKYPDYAVDVDVGPDALKGNPAAVSYIKVKAVIKNYRWSKVDVDTKDMRNLRTLAPE